MEQSAKEINYYFHLFRSNFTLGFIVISLCLVISLTIASFTPNIYKSTAVVVPSNSQYSSNYLSNNSELSGLASLAGIDVASSQVNQGSIALKTISSYDFFNTLYEDENFMKMVVAGAIFDQETNVITEYDIKFVNPSTFEWNLKPSLQQAYEIFYQKHFSSFKDRKTGFIYLHGEHRLPSVAQKITTKVVHNINEYMRVKDVEEAERALSYIEQKISDTSNLDVKLVLSKLAERELQTITLSKASDYFAFRVIQSAFFPEKKDRPHKSRMVFIGGILGLFFSVFLILILDFFNLKLS